MIKEILKFIFIILFLSLLNISYSFSEIIKKFDFKGNKRISSETIKVFIPFKIDDEINENDINLILKNLYETNFFKNVRVTLDNGRLLITLEKIQ